MKISWKLALFGPVVAALLAVPGVSAADDPANAIAYRQKVMSAIGAHIGAIGAVVKGEVSYGSHVAAHARAMHSLSLMVDDIFPEGSDFGETRAKPEIWEQPDKFAEAIKAFQTASGELAHVAEGGDMAAVGAALGKVGEACGGCHKPFRKPKE